MASNRRKNIFWDLFGLFQNILRKKRKKRKQSENKENLWNSGRGDTNNFVMISPVVNQHPSIRERLRLYPPTKKWQEAKGKC
jgi:hypothetical protein